ncbi:MAG: NADP-dependent oxidoreductase [Solirubrobacteraceae bacterium]|jgi:NADPH:quinone reductase-like Zn-dependent oxidoreductase
MHVIEVSELGGPEVLRWVERPQPVPAAGELVVRVAAANVNPTDLGARVGRFPRGAVAPPFVLGWDLAGTVAALGAGVEDFAVGDRVVGMIHWYDEDGKRGAYAEQVAVKPAWLVPLPPELGEQEAATVPLNALTADQGLALLDLTPASTLLVTGASGAVGSFTVQLAARAGHRVIAIAGRDDEAWPARLGASVVLPRDADLAGVGPVDALFDAVPIGAGAAHAVRDGGAIVTVRSRDTDEPGRGIRKQPFLIHHDRERMRELIADVSAGRLLTRVAQTVPLADAAKAHRLVEAGGLHGKVVLVS